MTGQGRRAERGIRDEARTSASSHTQFAAPMKALAMRVRHWAVAWTGVTTRETTLQMPTPSCAAERSGGRQMRRMTDFQTR